MVAEVLRRGALEAGDEAAGGGCAGSITTRQRESLSFQVRGGKIPCVVAGNVGTRTVSSPAQGKASGGQAFAARHLILCSIDNHPPPPIHFASGL